MFNVLARGSRALLTGLALTGLALAGLTGCVGQMSTATGDGESGEIRLALTAEATSGTQYRLRNAVFTLEGPDFRVVSGDEDAPEGASAVSTTLRVGTYQIQLERGWTLDRVEPDGSHTRVTAELAGANPISVTVSATTRATARFRFFIPADGMIETETGDVDVGFDVEEESCPVWYSDCDADGFAPADAETVTSCGTPSGGCGWTSARPVDLLSTDCNDSDARARPRTSTYYEESSAGGDFDFDCNGSEDMRSATMIDTTRSCRSTCIGAWGCFCTGPSGWTTRIPACGVSASWGYCTQIRGTCRFTADLRTQACR